MDTMRKLCRCTGVLGILVPMLVGVTFQKNAGGSVFLIAVATLSGVCAIWTWAGYRYEIARILHRGVLVPTIFLVLMLILSSASGFAEWQYASWGIGWAVVLLSGVFGLAALPLMSTAEQVGMRPTFRKNAAIVAFEAAIGVTVIALLSHGGNVELVTALLAGFAVVGLGHLAYTLSRLARRGGASNVPLGSSDS